MQCRQRSKEYTVSVESQFIPALELYRERLLQLCFAALLIYYGDTRTS